MPLIKYNPCQAVEKLFGSHSRENGNPVFNLFWIPAFAGMTIFFVKIDFFNRLLLIVTDRVEIFEWMLDNIAALLRDSTNRLLNQI